MKLVGATNWFVRGPFMLEGLLCGAAGSLAAIVLSLAEEGVTPRDLGHIETTSDVRALALLHDGADPAPRQARRRRARLGARRSAASSRLGLGRQRVAAAEHRSPLEGLERRHVPARASRPGGRSCCRARRRGSRRPRRIELALAGSSPTGRAWRGRARRNTDVEQLAPVVERLQDVERRGTSTASTQASLMRACGGRRLDARGRRRLRRDRLLEDRVLVVAGFLERLDVCLGDEVRVAAHCT